MTLILLLGLLQAPDDLATFLASLEKDRAAGVKSEELLKKVKEWSKGKPEEVLARLAWNRDSLEAAAKVDGLFVEGLRNRVGKHVVLGKSAGTIKEVKDDRVTLTVAGGTVDVEFAAIPIETRIDDVKRQGLLPAKSREEAILRFAGTRSIQGLTPILALPEEEKDAALSAIAGWVMQETDRALVPGATLKAAETFMATWGKQADLMRANWGALRKFIDQALVQKLLDEAAQAKDKKEARKILDLAASLSRSDEAVAKVTRQRFALIEKREWMGLPLQALAANGGTLDGNKIVCEDTKEGSEVDAVIIDKLPVPWAEISGVKARMKPGTCDGIALRIKIDKAIHSLNLDPSVPSAFHASYVDNATLAKQDPSKKLSSKPDYEFRAERVGTRWKFFVDSAELYSCEGGDPSTLFFIFNEGKAEIHSFDIRK